jgi:hypothetical protein
VRIRFENIRYLKMYRSTEYVTHLSANVLYHFSSYRHLSDWCGGVTVRRQKKKTHTHTHRRTEGNTQTGGQRGTHRQADRELTMTSTMNQDSNWKLMTGFREAS